MLNQMINRYVEQQRAMGFKYRIQNCLLQNFASFAQQRGDTYVRNDTVIEWAKQAPSVPQKRNRLLTVRRFSITMQAEDTCYEIPPADFFGRKTFKRRSPKILSSEELKCLLSAASKLQPENTIRSISYATLFALLAATGLRVGEVLALNIADITVDGLLIISTKFRKDRLVPIHESTRKGIQHYLKYRVQYGTDEPALFISNSGTRLCYPTVISIFLQLARETGLRGAPGDHGVCLHDLRHRFAVRSLEQCDGDRKAISHHMVALSTYLGHAHISDTYWYLHATPQLMKQIAITQEKFYKENNHD